MPAVIFSLIAFGLLVLAAPIFLAIITATFISFDLFAPPIPSMVLPQRMIDGVNRFALVAIPLFIFAADVISRGQIGKRLVALTEATMGHITGGVAIATAGACAIFGAMSGIGPAAVVSIGPIVYPSLVQQGYSKSFAVGLILSASTIAMLIPPGIAMILYSIETNNSVGDMFIAGLCTGILLTVVLGIYSYAYAKVKGIGRAPKVSWAGRMEALRRAGWALGLPVIVLGGIYSGAATPTEAAAFACVYAIVVETLIYRQLRVRDLFKVSAASAQTIAVLLILIASGTVMTYFMTLMQYPAQISQAIGGFPPSPAAGDDQHLVPDRGHVHRSELGHHRAGPAHLPVGDERGDRPDPPGRGDRGERGHRDGDSAFRPEPLHRDDDVPHQLLRCGEGCLPFVLLMIVVLLLVTYIPGIALFLL
jgi:C4-dicarboxylate transporter DctM subunit